METLAVIMLHAPNAYFFHVFIFPFVVISFARSYTLLAPSISEAARRSLPVFIASILAVFGLFSISASGLRSSNLDELNPEASVAAVGAFRNILRLGSKDELYGADRAQVQQAASRLGVDRAINGPPSHIMNTLTEAAYEAFMAIKSEEANDEARHRRTEQLVANHHDLTSQLLLMQALFSKSMSPAFTRPYQYAAELTETLVKLAGLAVYVPMILLAGYTIRQRVDRNPMAPLTRRERKGFGHGMMLIFWMVLWLPCRALAVNEISLAYGGPYAHAGAEMFMHGLLSMVVAGAIIFFVRPRTPSSIGKLLLPAAVVIGASIAMTFVLPVTLSQHFGALAQPTEVIPVGVGFVIFWFVWYLVLEGEFSPAPREPVRSDVFVSHASEDRDAVVMPLAASLRRHGLSVWVDAHNIEPGDSLIGRLDEGLSTSCCLVVIVSEAAMQSPYVKAELDAFLGREIESGSISFIVAVRHGVSVDRLRRWSPILARKYSLDTSVGTTALASAIDDILAHSARRR